MSNYLQYLIWVMLFVIIIEMIFPDSSYKKYIKLVLGCILVYTLLQPILGLIHIGGKNYDDYVSGVEHYLHQNEIGVIISEEYEEERQRQEKQLKEQYKKTLEKWISEKAEVEVTDVEIEFEGDEVESIYLEVSKKRGLGQIGTIKIGGKNETIDGDEEGLKNKIKKLIQEVYKVQVGNIHITVRRS